MTASRKRIKQRYREWSETTLPDEELRVESMVFNGSLEDFKRAVALAFDGMPVNYTIDEVDGNPVVHFHSTC